ncbi:MAG: hypothetical protein M3347_09880, partial [Armatimonadota bacterium]|nr:hypothetical protein [Armatimonadota bacterium]
PEVMQSTMNAPGGGGRYTEHVWQVTMSEAALVFSNHPTLASLRHPEQNTKTIEDALALYAKPRPAQPAPGQPWYWTYANVPPGHEGDVRPGYWQGSTVGPRTFGIGSMAFLVYNIPEDNPLPWAHVYLPRRAFDEVREEGEWVFLRQGNGYAALWLPGGYTPTTEGFWADTEIKLKETRCAVLSFIGNAGRDGSFAEFINCAKALQPQWDVQTLTLSALPTGGGERISVSYDNGPSQGGRKIETRGARFETPWGTMPLDSLTLQLRTPVGEYNLDLRDVLG